MTGVFVETFSMNSRVSNKRSVKKSNSYNVGKRENPNSHFEKEPLISKDTDSDDEITFQGTRYVQNNVPEDGLSFGLRNIKHGSSQNNGNATESTKSSDPFKNCEFIFLNVEEGDSLQSISIKYQCPVAEIKRANNLMNNQEIFALKHLKIPVKKHSLLTEILPSSDNITENSIIENFNSDSRTINIGIGTAGRCPSPQDSAAFFKRMDDDLVKIMLSTNSKKESLEAAAVALTTPQIQPLVKDSYSTYDCGIQWNYLIVFLIVIAIIIPFFIALYMYMKSSHEHREIVQHTTATMETIQQDPS